MRIRQGDSVNDFYYTLTANVNDSENFSPVLNETIEGGEGKLNGSLDFGNIPGFTDDFGGSNDFARGEIGDFSVIGYSKSMAESGNVTIVDICFPIMRITSPK